MSPITSFFSALYFAAIGLLGFDHPVPDVLPEFPYEQQTEAEDRVGNPPPPVHHEERSVSSFQRSSENVNGTVSESSSYTKTTVESDGESVESQTTNVKIYTDGAYRYIESNGIPNHTTGQFPNPGNPNTISEQVISVKVPLDPNYTGAQTPAHVPGIALNGILLEPGTAEREGGYNIEALQDTYNLGLDASNAHVQPTGLYHYHGVPEGYLDMVMTDEDMLQVGWAADGFPMYHTHSGQYRSGYELLDRRADGSTPDGTFTQDFVFANTGNLDVCNGAWLDDATYAYFITDEFPYIPRCLNGVPDASFDKRGGGAAAPSSPSSQQSAPGLPVGSNGSARPAGTPPAEAVSVCSDEEPGASCDFNAPHGPVFGSCENTPGGLACVPSNVPQPI